MAITSGFFNSLAGTNDRPYNATHFGDIFTGILTDGVLSAVGDALLVSPGVGMNVVLGSGKAWWLNTWLDNDSDLVLPIEPSLPTLNRIDIVALDFDIRDETRENSVVVVEGTPGVTPVAPTLINTSEHIQIPLSHVYVGATVTSFIPANITNKVGTVDCPFITNPLEHVTTSALLAQWESEFQAWFQDLQNELDENQVTNLQGQINDIEAILAGGTGDQVYRASGGVEGWGTVATGGIADNAITNAKIRDASGLSVIGRSANSVGDPADISASTADSVLRRSGSTLGFGQVATGGLADLSVTLAKLANNSVDDTKVGDRVPQVYRRQGSHASSWKAPGTTTYTPGAVRMQMGSVTTDGSGLFTVTFPVAFSNVPLVFVQAETLNLGMVATVYSISSTQCFIKSWGESGGAPVAWAGVGVLWLAIGPE